MKRIIALMLAAVIALAALAGCTAAPADTTPASDTDTAEVEKIDVRLGGMTGPTGLGMVKMLDDSDNGAAANNYDFTLAGSADVLAPMIITGELDIAAVPANLASVLYNKTEGNIEVLAVNTLGVLYVVETGEDIVSVSDLAGKTIYATGQGATPEYTLRYILAGNGIDADKDLTINWVSEPAEAISQMAAAGGGIALLPQPYVTVARGKLEGLRVALDITEEWNALGEGTCLTGVVVAQKAFVEEHPEQVRAFLDEYAASIDWVNANPAEAAALAEKYEIIAAAVAEKAIPDCNITFIAGSEMREALEGYLTVLFDQNPASVGGNMPADDFYYM